MNAISIIVSILIPLMVVVYIVLDLYSKKKTDSPVMSFDEKVDELLLDSNENHGERKSQKTIIDNTNYMLGAYHDIFKI